MRDAFLRRNRAESTENGGEVDEVNGGVEDDAGEAASDAGFVLPDARYAEMAAGNEYILTLAANGYGKRSSAFEYTVRNRGGQGIANIDLRSGPDNSVVGSFPVIPGEQLVLVTDHGQMIRTTVDDIRIARRTTRGVIVFRVADGERLVSVGHLPEDEAGNGNGNGAATAEAGGGDV